MKKLFKGLVVAATVAGAAFTLASCSNVSESYAKKVNKAVENKEPYTVEKVEKDLDNEFIVGVPEVVGVICSIKGVKDKDDWDEKVKNADENTKFTGILVTCALGKAIRATYVSGTAKEVVDAITKANSK